MNQSAMSATGRFNIGDIAKSLRLFTVAEGVERQEQADYLLGRGVDLVQGWLFSRPLPKPEFIAFYQRCLQANGPAPQIIQRDDNAIRHRPEDAD